jgi:hypothetical protein
MTTQGKLQKLKDMDTGALQRIVDTASPQETSTDRELYPLAGLVFISGMGHVPYTSIERELATRP